MRIPGRQIWSSLTAQWRGSFRLRLTVGLAATVLLIMSLWSAIAVYTQNAAIRESAEARARAFSQAFAMIGAAAVLENLFDCSSHTSLLCSIASGSVLSL